MRLLYLGTSGYRPLTTMLYYSRRVHGTAPQAHWGIFPGIASLRRFREDLKTTWEIWGRPLGQHVKAAIHCVTRPPAHPPRSVSPPPVGGGAGSGARPAPRPTPQTGGLSVCHTLTPPPPTNEGRESNAGVEIPMMALPNDSASDSKPTGGHAVVYFVPGQS